MLNVADPPSGLRSGLAAVFLFGLAAAVPVVGALVLALWRSLGAPSQEESAPPPGETAPSLGQS